MQTDSSPADFSSAVDLSSADASVFARSLYVGGAGDVKVDTVGGSTVTFVGVPAGSILPVRASKVYKVGTSATSILALW